MTAGTEAARLSPTALGEPWIFCTVAPILKRQQPSSEKHVEGSHPPRPQRQVPSPHDTAEEVWGLGWGRGGRVNFREINLPPRHSAPRNLVIFTPP